MPTNKEGFKMDPRLAETMARIKAEHPAHAVDAVNDSIVSEHVTPMERKKKYIDPDAMAHDLYHRMRQTDS